MRKIPIHIVILDDNALIAAPLSRYLSGRFGGKVNVAVFHDINYCLPDINDQSLVFILDYFLNEKEAETVNRRKTYDLIKKHNRKAEVILVSSREQIPGAIEEIQKKSAACVAKRERDVFDLLRLFDKVAVLPIRTFIIYPVKKIFRELSINNYLLMFAVAFVFVGVLVTAGFVAVDIFH
ncbi:MAG: hypothetical protein FD123_4355 [Bacteroidetes bacterium]|nr:MAG: hypothetical protein FD123_4355 [Bacteroidota bacterium]